LRTGWRCAAEGQAVAQSQRSVPILTTQNSDAPPFNVSTPADTNVPLPTAMVLVAAALGHYRL